MICAKIQKNRQYLSGAVQFTQTPATTPAPTPAPTPAITLVITLAPKGKKCTVFSFRMGFLAIFPRFWLMKGKKRAILGFQQAFLLGLYFQLCSRGHSTLVLKIQRGQSAGSVFGDVAWNVARRGFTNTVASTPRGRAPRNSCRRADLRPTRPGSSQRAKGECSSPRLREAWLLLRVTSEQGWQEQYFAQISSRTHQEKPQGT